MDATSESKSHTRPFKPIFVARCHRQTATDRVRLIYLFLPSTVPSAPAMLAVSELGGVGTE